MLEGKIKPHVSDLIFLFVILGNISNVQDKKFSKIQDQKFILRPKLENPQEKS